MKYIRNYILLAFLAWNIANLDASSSSAKPPLFTSNHVVKIEGNFLDLKPLDVTLIGSGPDFVVYLDEPAGRIEINLQPLSDDKFCIQYTIAFSVEKKAGTSIQYKDISIAGKVIIEDGKSIPIAKVGDHALTLALGDPKK